MLHDYYDGEQLLEAYIARPKNDNGKCPAVLVAHDWSGKNEFSCNKADELAALGMVGIAIDMFGKGKLGKTKEEKTALITPFVNDRAALLKRIMAAYSMACELPFVQADKIGAIGFCFGGLCVLDLARSGIAIRGVVSFHGLLFPNGLPANTIKARILVLHGYNDPMVPPAQVVAFSDEMTKAKADWQVVMYGNTVHAFMNPEANDPDFGTVYDAKIADRAWVGMMNFFDEVM